MKVLFDTNILIELEQPGTVLPDDLAEMVRLSRELGYEIVLHPGQVEDFRRDGDANRRDVQLSRIRQHPELPNPPEPTREDLAKLGWTEANDNDRIDNLLLFAIKRSAASILVTEDRRMLAKARRVGLEARVHNADDYLAYLQGQRRIGQSQPAEWSDVKTVPVSHLDPDDHFFDSLRQDYGADEAFTQWLAKCSEKGREAWVVLDGKALGALCIFKEEMDEPIGTDGSVLKGKSLKLCTFKVSAQGKKLGERLLYVAFDHARRNGCRHVYLTTRTEKQPHLVHLMDVFGFEKRCRHISSRDDDVYVKPMEPSGDERPSSRQDYLDYAIRFYPHVKFDSPIRRYLVPIQPQFHDRLFPDAQKQLQLFGERRSEANAIRKAYLCRSPSDSLEIGDLLFFYQSRKARAVECLGIVEAVERLSDPDEILSLVSKRTVYSEREIRDMAGKGPLLVILFRLVRQFESPVLMSQLSSNGVVGNIQSIRELPERAFETLFRPLLEACP